MRKTLDELIAAHKAALARLNARKSSKSKKEHTKQLIAYGVAFKALAKARKFDTVFGFDDIINGLEERYKNEVWNGLNAIKAEQQQQVQQQ